MKVYLDTNVLVAASVIDHPHHPQSFDLISAVKSGRLQGYVNTHGLAEYYSVITRTPFTPRVHPSEAGRFLDGNVLAHFELLTHSAKDYTAVLRSCAEKGLIGGVVFDALHLHSAMKADCERLYTFNVKDFRALAPAGFIDRITAP